MVFIFFNVDFITFQFEESFIDFFDFCISYRKNQLKDNDPIFIHEKTVFFLQIQFENEDLQLEISSSDAAINQMLLHIITKSNKYCPFLFILYSTLYIYNNLEKWLEKILDTQYTISKQVFFRKFRCCTFYYSKNHSFINKIAYNCLENSEYYITISLPCFFRFLHQLFLPANDE